MKTAHYKLTLIAMFLASLTTVHAQKGPAPMSFANASKSFLNTSKCKKSDLAKIDRVKVENFNGSIFVNLITDNPKFDGADTPLLGPLQSKPTDEELAGLKGKNTCFGY